MKDWISYSQNHPQALQNIVIIVFLRETVSRDFTGDVCNQLVEECNLKQFVEGDQLEVGNSSFTETRRRRCIWKSAMRIFFNHLQVTGARIGHSIRQCLVVWDIQNGNSKSQVSHAQKGGNDAEAHSGGTKKNSILIQWEALISMVYNIWFDNVWSNGNMKRVEKKLPKANLASHIVQRQFILEGRNIQGSYCCPV